MYGTPLKHFRRNGSLPSGRFSTQRANMWRFDFYCLWYERVDKQSSQKNNILMSRDNKFPIGAQIARIMGPTWCPPGSLLSSWITVVYTWFILRSSALPHSLPCFYYGSLVMGDGNNDYESFSMFTLVIRWFIWQWLTVNMQITIHISRMIWCNKLKFTIKYHLMMIVQMIRAFGMNPKVGGSSPPQVETFFVSKILTLSQEHPFVC